MRRLSVSIIGGTGSDSRYDPSRVFRDDLAHTVCLLLAEDPRSAGDLTDASGAPESRVTEVVGRLADLHAVRQEDGRLHLNFSLLTVDDLRHLDRLTLPLSRALADKVVAEAEAIKAGLAGLDRPGQPGTRPQLAFATVGCFGLDWKGIGVLHELGHVGLGHSYPGAGRYVLIAEVEGALKSGKDYCGSRTHGGERYAFTSFGDDSGPRHCLPDLIVHAQKAVAGAEWPADLADAVQEACGLGFQAAYDALGAMVAGATSADGPGAELLRRTGYLDGGRARVPVFTGEDLPAVQAILDAVGRAVAAWAVDEVPGLPEALAPLTPVRHKVSQPDFLNHIWHFIFAGANRLLAEAGFMLDPEPGPGGQGRYLAWVGEAEFYRAVWRMCLPEAERLDGGQARCPA